MRALRRPEAWVFVLLLGSYAYFWHARDWNCASRLMLTYAIVDRGTIALNGLERQTGDIAKREGRYYTDKLPGFSFLATVPYAIAKVAFGLPSHPLGRPGFPYWAADYWTTLGTSGLLSALTGVVLVGLARDLGCGPRRTALVGLAYGLATPAYVYATLGYGHQASSFALLTSFALLWRMDAPRAGLRAGLAGFLAAYAAVIELQVGPVSVILALYVVAQALGGRRRVSNVGDFAVGALIPTLILLVYNQLAFGSPWKMGYFYEVDPVFAAVHNAENPLGLNRPAWSRALALLFGGYRGLLFYAPVIVLAIPGWIIQARRGLWGMASVSAAAVLAVFAVNLCYPQWTGGWSTGPRLLVPLLPFAMLPVASTLAAGGRWTYTGAIVLAIAGGLLMLLFQGVGGRVSQDVADPLRDYVLIHWRGDPLPPTPWEVGGRFTRDVVSVLFPNALAILPERWQWMQFVPLVLFQAAGVFAGARLCSRQLSDRSVCEVPTSDLRPAC